LDAPFAPVELSEEDDQRLQDVSKAVERVELAVELLSQEKHAPVWEKRRHVLKTIPRFWPTALINHPMFSIHAAHAHDHAALSHLEDVWVSRNPEEKRCFTVGLVQYFKENPYFSNPVLKKEYKYIPPPAPLADDPADENGITEQMCEFSWDTNVEAQAFKIDWKDDAKNLTKLHPPVYDEDSEVPSEPGSFFNYFEVAKDSYDLGIAIANEIFPDAIDYFHNRSENVEDSDEEDSEDDDDEDEIDLEKPRTKKQRT